MTIAVRLKGLVRQTAADIKECANACDTYSKKRTLVKVFKSSVWDLKLSEYVQRFIGLKAEFNSALSIHTGMAVDRANDKLDTIMSKYACLRIFEQKTH